MTPERLSEIELAAKTDRELLLLTVMRVNDVCALVQDHKSRMSKLEQWRDKAVGMLAVLGLAVPASVSAFVAWLFR